MQPRAHRLAYYLLPALCLLAGCQTGNSSLLFGGPHRLIPEARALKSSYPEALALPRELDKAVWGPYLVEPGDALLILPERQDSPISLPADQPVLPDGRIQLGVYGFLHVAGKTLEQIEPEVNAVVHAKTKDAPQITVRLTTTESKVYYVLGEVNAPNAYQFRGRETVLDGIMRAGGLTSAASRRDILLSRPTPPPSCRLVLPVCYNDIVQLGDTTTNYHLRPGDRIYVPTRCLGETLCPDKPGCLPCGQGAVPCPIPAAPAKQGAPCEVHPASAVR
jgi:protein involved in polysaccharide export with SLBB domain